MRFSMSEVIGLYVTGIVLTGGNGPAPCVTITSASFHIMTMRPMCLVDAAA